MVRSLVEDRRFEPDHSRLVLLDFSRVAVMSIDGVRAEVAVSDEGVIVPRTSLMHVLRRKHRGKYEVGPGDCDGGHAGQSANHALHY